VFKISYIGVFLKVVYTIMLNKNLDVTCKSPFGLLIQRVPVLYMVCSRSFRTVFIYFSRDNTTDTPFAPDVRIHDACR
jgi:hypothetical protein